MTDGEDGMPGTLDDDNAALSLPSSSFLPSPLAPPSAAAVSLSLSFFRASLASHSALMCAISSGLTDPFFDMLFESKISVAKPVSER
jgi:hypothetical protein